MSKSKMTTKRNPSYSDTNAAFVTTNKELSADVILGASKALGAYVGIPHRVGGGLYDAHAQRDRYVDVSPNQSVRNQFGRDNYEYFRPSEEVARKKKDIIAQCMEAYRRVGIVRNIIDLMGDFTVQGIRITHPNPRIEKFWRGWWKKVQGTERSERGSNLLYRCGVMVAKRTMAKISVPTERKLRTIGQDRLQPDTVMEPELTTQKRNIPIRYNFLNPLSLEVVGGPLAQFVGKTLYALKVTAKLRQAIQYPKTDMEREMIAALPADILNAIQQGKHIIPLDNKKIQSMFYKKDDWDEWADPMIYAIMDDLILLEKMKLADLAALDGAISQIRVWKLGDLEKGIFPTDAAINKLADILLSNPGGGAFDLIWGPELTVDEYRTNVHEFLGNEKYVPVLNGIYAGLGVPPTLTGAATASGFTNNYISLQTLIQRLEYGRQRLTSFWEKEIELVRQAMGFQRPAHIEFDHMTLSDEAAEKALLLQLADRDIVSVDTLLERFGEDPEFEELKWRREDRQRKAKLMAPKTSPWHTPEKMFELIKTALGRGYVSPEQAGIDIPDEYENQTTPFQQQMDMMSKRNAGTGGPNPGSSNKGQPQAGRPKNSGDQQQRKTRTPKPAGASVDQTAALITNMMWAREAQHSIAEILNPYVLEFYEKKNMRSLSAEETQAAEDLKFAVLANLEPFCEITDEDIQEMAAEQPKLATSYRKMVKKFTQAAIDGKGRQPTIDELRTIQATTYALINIDMERFNGNN